MSHENVCENVDSWFAAREAYQQGLLSEGELHEVQRYVLEQTLNDINERKRELTRELHGPELDADAQRTLWGVPEHGGLSRHRPTVGPRNARFTAGVGRNTRFV
jgi:hypothetical protein